MTALAKPNSPALPPPPSGDFFNETQWTVLLAFLDAVVPRITAVSQVKDPSLAVGVPDTQYHDMVARARKSMAEAPPEDIVETYLGELPSENPAFVYAVRRAVYGISTSDKMQLGAVLLAMS
jgi:hypothetical protein